MQGKPVLGEIRGIYYISSLVFLFSNLLIFWLLDGIISIAVAAGAVAVKKIKRHFLKQCSSVDYNYYGIQDNALHT